MPRSKTRQEVLDAFCAAFGGNPLAQLALYLKAALDGEPMPKELAAAIQAFLVEYLKAPLAVDGIVGPRTRYALMCAWDLLQHDRIGAPMFVGGIATHFGGPEDAWDRYNGQAFLPHPRAGESPREYYHRVPDWVRGHLQPDMGHLSRWPQTTDEKGVSRPAGVSYFMQGDYAALRIAPRSPLGEAAREGRVYVEVVNAADPSRAVVARVTDYGPHPRVSATIDLAPTAYRVVAAKSARVLFRLGVRPVLVEGD